MPTGEQGKSCIRVCQSLANFYPSINIVRFDERQVGEYVQKLEKKQED